MAIESTLTAAAPTSGEDTRPASRLGLWVRRHGLSTGLVLILAYLVLFPLGRLQYLALENGAEAYREAIALPNLGQTLFTTLLLGAGSLVIAVGLGTLLAWFAMRLPQGMRWLATIPILPMVLPAVAVVVGWAFLFSPQVGYINLLLRQLPFVHVEQPEVGLPAGPLNVYTVAGVILVTGIQLVPLIFLFVQSSLRQFNYESIEASLIAGAGPVRTFVLIVIPLLRPALVYSAAFAMLLGLGQLTAPQFLGTREGIRVLATEVYRFGGESPVDFPLSAAVASPLLVAGIVFIVAQRILLRRDFRFVTAGTRGATRPLKPSPLAAPAIIVYGIVTLVLPFLALILVSLSPFWTSSVDLTRLTFDNYFKAFDDPAVINALTTSVVVSLAAMGIALPLGYLLTEVLYRRRGNAVVRAIIDTITQVPLGVPAVVFGVGFLYVYLGNPFMLYGTPLLMILVYVVLVLPFTVRLQLTARMTLGSTYEDAARASGAGVLRTHLGVMVPMMRGALAGASILMFVILTHEFAASMFVRSTRVQVLGTLLYDQWSRGSYPMVATIAIIMSAVTAAGLLLAAAVGGRAASLDKL
ncbi:ABC transporter permease [Microbacterium immunditiarum]|uniref:Iron(III) transport system permease protein n=1 Tax=Microbacterium immunditiarum TaxID=337480 RepID=A0A7Y9GLN0_9MICO|nr:iron ABC transporter permease [Microbacterium immunditiarum]NYE18793.1 iron(III) transport system permease protein [Microbacterium immunditiarum]